MKKARVYANLSCSKSCGVTDLLAADGYAVEEIYYLEAMPTTQELRTVLALLGGDVRPMIRSGEARFRELGLSLDDARSDAQWLEILNQNPVLLQRPIVLIGERAIIARPPERVREIYPDAAS